jgi:exodeoxyribonuclease-3
MKFVSWNVNGLRACMNKGFLDSFYQLDADFFCLQETKLQSGQIDLDLPGYEQYWCYAEKKGYSGTAIFTKHHPMSVSYGLGVPALDTEGRLITLEYPEFFLVTCYTPNAQRGLARIEHRLKWEEAFRSYLTTLDQKKPVILCGDLNVAHKEIDLKNPASNRGNAGFSDEERSAFTQLLNCGFTDSFRYLYPDKTGAYSWWSYMFNARANNAGWRIDYFVVSDRLQNAIHDATIHPDVMGSDHCPVGLDLNITCNGGIWSPETQLPEKKDATKADGDPPAGLILKLGITAVCILSLLIPVFSFLRKEPTVPQTTAPQKTLPPAISGTLIQQIINRSGTAGLTVYFPSPVSSHYGEMIVDGDEQWILQSKSFLYSTPGTVPSDKIPSATIGTTQFPLSYNFFVQLIFSSDQTFYADDLPVIDAEISSPGNVTAFLSYYTDADNRIEGCFLYGYAENRLSLQVTASYHNVYHSCEALTILSTGYFENMTTSELINYISRSQILVRAMLSGDSEVMDDLIKTDPYIQTLLKRSDAIEKLLHILKANKGFTPIGSPTILLYRAEFKNRMTDAERAQMDEIISNFSDVPIYGTTTP